MSGIRRRAIYKRTVLERNTFKAQLEMLQIAHRALQARLDAVMMEHCPDEMTGEQKARWAAAQTPAGLVQQVFNDA